MEWPVKESRVGRDEGISQLEESIGTEEHLDECSRVDSQADTGLLWDVKIPEIICEKSRR